MQKAERSGQNAVGSRQRTGLLCLLPSAYCLLPSRSAYCLLLTAFCLMAGCSKLVSVEGKVLYDGKPLPLATLIFFPEGQNETRGGERQSHTMSDSDGAFRLNTINKHGGMPGKYKVVVSKLEHTPESNPKPHPDPTNPMATSGAVDLVMRGGSSKQVLPARYTTEKDTPLRVEIPADGTKNLIIELKSNETPLKSKI